MPFEIPDGWEWVRLDGICEIKGGKRVPRGESFAKAPTEHIYIRVTNMKDNTIVDNELKYISEDVYEQIKNYTISSDDLYLTIAGTIGDVGDVPKRYDGMNLTENAAKLTNLLCSKYYLMYALLSTVAQEHFTSKFHQVAQPKLSIETASSTLIPIPPYEEQKRIEKAVGNLLDVINDINSNTEELQENIKQTKTKVLDLAIHGKLVLQDPKDEPAIELLKRINPKFTPCDNAHYGSVPRCWTLCKIKDVFQINPKIVADDNSDAGFVPMANVQDSFCNGYSFEQRTWGSIKKGYTHFQDGDIVVAKISPCLENRKSAVVYGLPNGIGAGTTELNVFRSEHVNPLFGLYFFKSDYFISQCVGTFNGVVGQQRVSTKIIEDIAFPLPSLSEQLRITKKIEELFSVLDRIEQPLKE